MWPCEPVTRFRRFGTDLLGNLPGDGLSMEANDPANFSLGMARVVVIRELPSAVLALHRAAVNPAVTDG